MIVTTIEDFENEVRKYIDKANYDYVFIIDGDKQYILMSEERMSSALYGAVAAGEQRAKQNNEL